jgi:hypothetical protein
MSIVENCRYPTEARERAQSGRPEVTLLEVSSVSVSTLFLPGAQALYWPPYP